MYSINCFKAVIAIGVLSYAYSTNTCAQQPIFQQENSLLITSVRTGDTEVFIVGTKSGNAFNVTQAPFSEERYPAWSPDGKEIIFTSNRQDSTTYNLYIAEHDGSHPRKLTDFKKGRVVYWPAFTKDGKYIYFNEGVEGIIHRIQPDGKGLKEIVKGRDANISPDGKTLVFTQQGVNGWGVWTMDSDGKNKKQIVKQESEIGGVAPVWSHDGRFIAFSGQVGEFAEIFICDATGENLKQITTLQKISSSPAFSSDNKSLSFRVTDEAYWRSAEKREQIYKEKDGAKRPVWVINIDGTNLHIVEPLRYHCAMDGSRAEWRPK